MNQKSYDAGLLFGTLMLFGGAVAMWDWAAACVVTGSTILVLTVVGALLSRKG